MSEFQGQEHLTGKNKLIYSFLKNNKISSLIFWGPPGTGKTTLSKILVSELDLPAVSCSATISKINEVREIMKRATETKKLTKKPLVVFVDEIHHFNKHSQDAFLPFIESGDIILLGTTIENPAYKINRALLSRIKILEFYLLSSSELQKIMNKAISFIKEVSGKKFFLNERIEKIILNYSAGDARRLLNLIEVLFDLYLGKKVIDEKSIMNVIQNRIGAYDRSGDDRYQFISAFHKSIRNSDLDAALFWLYRMVGGGEDPLYIIRRMIRIAVEDIGFADPQALRFCLDCKDAYEYLGSPEGDLFLAQAAVYLAVAPKSNSLYKTEERMKKLIQRYKNESVPLHLINPDNIIAVKKGAGQGYVYAHDVKERTTVMKTLPDKVKESDFFVPDNIGFEKKIKERMSYWRKIKNGLKKK